MAESAPTILGRIFQRIVALRWVVLAFYAFLLPPAIYFAVQVGQDNSLDRLIVPEDPDFLTTRGFEKVFGGGEFALLLFEADDPFALGVVERVDRVERGLKKVEGVSANSALSTFRRARAGFQPTPEQVEAFRNFATGTQLFRKQGMIGDKHLALALVIRVRNPAERAEMLHRIDEVVAEVDRDLGPLHGVHRLGQPYVNVYLDETQRSASLYFGVFAIFVVVLNWSLYRSWRTLIAFLITLAVCLVVSVGYIGITGGTFTLVSPMVPMTILVTATATLVYMHSRFVDRPPDREVDEHQIFALTNKFVACTASVFATAVGFAALAVSDIRPIKEMGIWVAVGLTGTWVIVMTLFPALQKVLQTPTRIGAGTSIDGFFERLADWLPHFTYRWRWPLVISSIALSIVGAVSLFGFPGLVAPMQIRTNAVAYMNPNSSLYKDIKRLTPMLPGLSITHVWLVGKFGEVSEPDVLNGLHAYQQALEADPEVGDAVGLSSVLRLMRYVGGEGDAWPTDPAVVDEMAANVEGLLSTEPMLQRFVQPHELAQTQVTVISRVDEYEGFQRIEALIRRCWEETVAKHPALKSFELRTAGLTPLNAKMARNLVPTLTESFALTVIIIFGAFLLVFRNGTARLMAMIPSLFAILVMFAFMRATGIGLNIATILIASTVLGTSENDQIHFFYHFIEGRKTGTVEQALRHTLRVSGRAIVFATLINAGGFLAFMLGELPPMQEFGMLSALAFTLSMVADFTALPAALWILLRARPDPVEVTRS